MRKRSAVADPAPTTTQAAPATAPAAPRPPAGTDRIPGNVELFQGMVFARCLECGLNGNIDAAKPLPGNQYGCTRCGTNLDPDGGVLTPAYVVELKGKAKDAMGNPAPPPVDKTKCELCGAKLTVTSAGTFYPCGHGKQEQNAAPVAPPIVKQDSPEDVKNREQRDRVVGQTVNTPTVPDEVKFAEEHRQKQAKADRPANMQAAARGDSVTNVHNAHGGADRVTVVYGEEVFSPAQYQSFRVGPFTMETDVRPGETPAEASDRAMIWLRGFAKAEFARKAQEFSERLASFAKR